MPQTSPMSWIMMSNLVLIYFLASSSIFSVFSMEMVKLNSSIEFFNKKWMW